MIQNCAYATVLFILLQSCNSPVREPSTQQAIQPDNRYARGFWTESHPGFKVLHVRDPWQGSSGIHMSYVLASGPENVPDSLAGLPFVRIPVSRVICMSTTHVAMIDALGRTGTIVGISGPDYIRNPGLRGKILNGEVRDVGADPSLNFERIVALDPDLVMAYGITAEVSGTVRRLEELGIPVILNGDYLEDEPLGKTEWIRFIAAFYGMERTADSIFEGIALQYEKYRELAEDVPIRPKVMTGLPWKDVWYVPGEKSFAAAFIRDAGGEYVWKDMDNREAVPVDLESVFARAGGADLWINSGAARSLGEIRLTEARLTQFKPFREGRVYNNIARLNPAGGNDFWETGTMEPHLILADLIRIFHPGLLPGKELRYYERLQ